MRIGTGEFTDSLALDTITEYSLPIIEFFRKHPKAIFEFKTKSIEIKNILRAGAPHNIVVSWSINPQKIITENEYFTPALTHRLAAALQCVAAGLRVGFHFDPVIYFNGWEEDYHLAIESLFNTIPQRAIIWVSIGTFRFSPELKPVIERRFPGNKILDEELVLGFDGKLRYPSLVRYHMYQKIIEMLRRHSRAVPLYLCMEDVEMWKALKIKMPYFR
jgi:spore photoproduct lyase